MSKRSSNEKKHHDNMAKETQGACWANDSAAGQLRQNRKADMAKRYINTDREIKVLEIGCGNGEFSKRFVGIKAKMTCVDISPEFIALLKKNYHGTNIDFVCADVEKLPFSDNYFDAVIGNGVLHHLNIDIAVKEIHRVLKNDGKIFFSEPNLLNPEVFLETKVHWIGKLAQKTEDECAFTKWGIKKFFQNNGFKNVHVTPFDFLHPLTPKPLIPAVSAITTILEAVPLIKDIAGSIKIEGEKA